MKGESKLLLLCYKIEAKKFRIILSFKLCFNDHSHSEWFHRMCERLPRAVFRKKIQNASQVLYFAKKFKTQLVVLSVLIKNS